MVFLIRLVILVSREVPTLSPLDQGRGCYLLPWGVGVTDKVSGVRWKKGHWSEKEKWGEGSSYESYGLFSGMPFAPLGCISSLCSHRGIRYSIRAQKKKDPHSSPKMLRRSAPGAASRCGTGQVSSLREKWSLSFMIWTGPHAIHRYSFGPSSALHVGIPYRKQSPVVIFLSTCI